MSDWVTYHNLSGWWVESHFLDSKIQEVCKFIHSWGNLEFSGSTEGTRAGSDIKRFGMVGPFMRSVDCDEFIKDCQFLIQPKVVFKQCGHNHG